MQKDTSIISAYKLYLKHNRPTIRSCVLFEHVGQGEHNSEFCQEIFHFVNLWFPNSRIAGAF